MDSEGRATRLGSAPETEQAPSPAYDGPGQFGLAPDIDQAWRKRAISIKNTRAHSIRIELPSGLAVMAIRASLRWQFNNNKIPDPLLAVVEEHIALIEADDPNAVTDQYIEDMQADPVEAFGKWMQILDAAWMGAVTQPLFTDDKAREGVDYPPYWIGDVEYFDKMYLYQWLSGVDEDVAEFFRKQADALGTLEAESSIPLSPEGTVRVDRYGRPVAGEEHRPSGLAVGDVHSGENRRARRKAEKKAQKQQRAG